MGLGTTVGNVAAEGGLALVLLPQLLQSRVQLVGAFQRQQDIVGRVVGRETWGLRQFGAEEVRVLIGTIYLSICLVSSMVE